MPERRYDGMRAYAQSKLALAMFTFDLSEQLAGTGVTANCLHPATLMDTRMVREGFGAPMSSTAEGARATERLITSPELADVSGRYSDGMRETRANGQAYDLDARARLRELSERLTGA
ncbi:MAG: SDR family NAD(P)-dependent oxidoreductase [Streptosporangiaceae bacterium]